MPVGLGAREEREVSIPTWLEFSRKRSGIRFPIQQNSAKMSEERKIGEGWWGPGRDQIDAVSSQDAQGDTWFHSSGNTGTE